MYFGIANEGMGQWTNNESIPNFFIFIFKSAEKINYSHYLVIHQSDRQRDGQIDRKHSYMETHTIVIQKMDRHTVNRENTAVVTCTDSGYTNREPADKGHLDRGKRTSDRR